MIDETILFVEYFRKKLGIAVDFETAKIGWEGVILHHEEIDEDLFTKIKLDNLPNPLLFLIIGHTDEGEREWIFCLVVDENEPSKWYSAYCLKNGDVFEKEIPFDKYIE